MKTTIYEIILRKFSSQCCSFKFVGGYPTREDVLAVIEQSRAKQSPTVAGTWAQHAVEIVKNCGVPEEGGDSRTTTWHVLGSTVGSVEIKSEHAWEKEI